MNMPNFLLTTLLFLTPTFLFAQEVTMFDIVNMFIGVLPGFMWLAISIALLVFIWGVLKMIFGLGDTDTDSSKVKEEGKKRMIWGLIALFVLVSVWGLVAIVINTFGLEGSATTTPPPTVRW